MTSKDNRTKAELAAELDAKEQALEAQQKELEQAKAAKEEAEKRADRVLAETEQAQGASDASQPGAPVLASAAAPGEPAPSPDGRYHFHSRYRQYQIPGVKFFDNRFATGDETVVDRLKSHRAFGSEFWLTFVPGDSKKAA